MGATGRRRWLAGIAGAAALAGGTFGVAAAASAQDSGGEGLLPPGDWTAEQVAQAEAMVAAAADALPAFADETQLEALGFYDFGGRAPGGWDHWIHPGWMADDVYLDPTRPESLVFRATDEGDYVLEAAMYILPEGYTMETIPDEVAWVPGWHTHDDICVDDQGRFSGTTGPDGTCFSGTPLTWPPMAHVWIADNPCGHRFAGVDVGGIVCGDHHHDPDPDPDPDPPGHGGHDDPPDDPEPPGHGGHGGHNPPNDPEPPGHGDGHGNGNGNGHGSHNPPATPIPGNPHLHG
jgi:hypothetical protein